MRSSSSSDIIIIIIYLFTQLLEQNVDPYQIILKKARHSNAILGTVESFIDRLCRFLIWQCWFVGEMNFLAPKQSKSARQPVRYSNNESRTCWAQAWSETAPHDGIVSRFRCISARRRLSPTVVCGSWTLIRGNRSSKALWLDVRNVVWRLQINKLQLILNIKCNSATFWTCWKGCLLDFWV